MALQGDLDSFALPDVLRLLAGTGKTGRLAVTSGPGQGEIWLRDGDVVGGSVTSSPHAVCPEDLLFELLRFDGGSFVFDDSEQLVEAGEHATVDDAIATAEALMAEWAEVEAVVPSVHSWVSLAPEIQGDHVTVSAEQWKLLASLAAGSTVRGMGDCLEVTDLVASRRVKALVEAGLVDLGDAPEHHAPVTGPETTPDRADPSVEIGTGAGMEPVHADLAILSAEEGPVIIETSDDAHLPEPLPSEGTSFAGETGSLGAVDGRTFEAEAAAMAPVLIEAPPEPSTWSSYGSFGEPDRSAPIDDSAPSGLPEAGLPDAGLPDGPAPEAAADDEPAPDKATDDRGPLLKFLSSVKP